MEDEIDQENEGTDYGKLRLQLVANLNDIFENFEEDRTNEHLEEADSDGDDSDDDEGDHEEFENTNDIDSSMDEDKEDEQVDAERDNLIRKIQIKHEYFSNNESQRQLAQKYSLSRRQVRNIVERKSRLDGSSLPGRRPHLRPETEVMIAQEIRRLQEQKNISLRGNQFTRICQDMWIGEGNVGEPPLFGKGYRIAFNRRHAGLKVKFYRTAPMQERRQNASKLSTVSNCLNKLKNHLRVAKAKYVYVMDELNVSANDKALGEKRIGVGGLKPFHTTTNKTPHISAVPFFGLDGLSSYIAFVVQRVKESADGDRIQVSDIDIFNNAKGSVDSEVWGPIIDGFCSFIDKRLGMFQSERKEIVTLIFDGYKVHQEVFALGALERHGIQAIVIPPNLTHIVQIGDHGRVNGAIQNKVKQMKQSLCAENGGKMIDLNLWCNQVAVAIRSTVDLKSLVVAAKSIGIRYSDGFKSISMTKESVEIALQHFLSKRKITDDTTETNVDALVLRNSAYLEDIKAMSGLKNRPHWTASAALRMDDSANYLAYELTGQHPPKRRARTFQRPATKRSRANGDPYVVNDPTSGRAIARGEKVLADIQAAKEKKERAAEKRIAKAKLQAEKMSRFEALKTHFAGCDITPFRRSIARYLCGSQTFEAAVANVQKKLSK